MPKKKTAAAEAAELRALVEQLTAKVAQLEASNTKTRHSRGEARPWITYTLLGIPERGSIQPQAIICCRLLSAAANPSNISEPEAMELIRAGAEALDTVQDPWTVFRFYRARLIQMDCLRMPVRK